MSRRSLPAGVLLTALVLASPLPVRATGHPRPASAHHPSVRSHRSTSHHAHARSKTLDDVRTQFVPHAVGDIFGVGSFVTQRSWTLSSLLVRRARELGTKWVREEFTASRLHAGTTGRYRWTEYDRTIDQERKAGLNILGLLDYSNTWSFHDHGTMPHSDMHRLATDFARYAHDVARHFRGRVRYWEIWNEPNVDAFWHPAPDPSDYALLLDAAGTAIRRVDRKARIVLAGTSGMDLPFIRAVAARTRRFDVLAVHPYRDLPEPRFLQQVRNLRHLHKPIWFSEIGWPAGDGCESCFGEVEQARYLVRFYALAAAAGIQRVFWYDLRDDPHTASNPEAHFGLMRRDLSGKASFIAFAYLSRLLDGSHYLGADSLGRHGQYTLRFQRGTTHFMVLWNTSNTNRTLRVKWTHPEANFIDMGGHVLAQLTPVDDRVSVVAPQGGEPFYLVNRLPSYRVPAIGALLHFAPPPPPPTPRPARRTAHPHRPGVVKRAAWAQPTVQTRRTATPRPTEHSIATVGPRTTPTAGPRASPIAPPPAP